MFPVVKFMTKIGQKKTSGNCFQKLKNVESSECWPKLYKTMLNWKLLMLTHLSMKLCYPYFWAPDMQYPKHFWLQKFSMNTYYWVSVELSMCTPPPLWGNKVNLWLKIPVGDNKPK